MAPAAPQIPTGRRSRKRHATAGHLAATAFGLFETHGYDAVTMEQIAAAADVAKGTLYNHFAVKEALLAHQFRQEIAAGMVAIHGDLQAQPGLAARMRRLLTASAQWNTARRAYLPHYLRFRMAEIDPAARRLAGEEQRSGVAEILESLFSAGQQAGELRADLDARQLAVMFEFMCLGAVTAWLHEPETELQQRFEFALDVLLDGIAATVASRRTKR